ncbi:MAG: hypothetical protein FWE63_01900 [Bacteroidales bacterium]|nr:hypothetical protein [Bacteroidales bacterium]
MKKTICIAILALFGILTTACLIVQHDSDSTSITQQVQQKNEEIMVNSLTFAVSAIEAILSWISIYFAIFALILAALTSIGYYIAKKYKKNIDKMIGDRIEQINKKEEKFNNYIVQTKAIKKKLSMQEKYIENTNQYLYEAIDEVANQINEEKGKAILKKMHHNYQVTNLYSEDNNTKFAALAYLQENGTRSDIEHLEYVSNYDSEEANKRKAREIIGIIKHKYPIIK